jgi:hypothetical protein
MGENILLVISLKVCKNYEVLSHVRKMGAKNCEESINFSIILPRLQLISFAFME